jgi:hypothetical protein
MTLKAQFHRVPLEIVTVRPLCGSILVIAPALLAGERRAQHGCGDAPASPGGSRTMR